jgi:hypothetical protein
MGIVGAQVETPAPMIQRPASGQVVTAPSEPRT